MKYGKINHVGIVVKYWNEAFNYCVQGKKKFMEYVCKTRAHRVEYQVK